MRSVVVFVNKTTWKSALGEVKLKDLGLKTANFKNFKVYPSLAIEAKPNAVTSNSKDVVRCRGRRCKCVHMAVPDPVAAQIHSEGPQ